MHRLVPFVAVVACGLLPQHAAARLIPSWPHDRLLKEAEVVVVATALSSAETGERSTSEPWKCEFLHVNTAFRVSVVLKGELQGEQLTVLHYRLKPGTSVPNGPLLVTFRMRDVVLRSGDAKVGLGVPQYLLFLKKRADGRFEAVTGQIDPALSVRELFHPLPPLPGEARRE